MPQVILKNLFEVAKNLEYPCNLMFNLAKSKIIYFEFCHLLLKSDKTLDTNIFMRKIKYVRSIIMILLVDSKNIETQLCMNNFLHM